MRLAASRYVCVSCRNGLARPKQKTAALSRVHWRRIQISATPASSATRQQSAEGTTSDSDARFEVLGTPYSLLSASIAASQNLYTRKGTLVGFQGKAENAVSTLSALEPFRRALAGIPFLYQRIQSTTPYTALIATRSPITSLAVIHLDGRVDWMVAQRNALLAWTGHTLSLTPRLSTSLGLAHWGRTSITGRGLMALAGKGTIYQVTIKAGEEYVLHPANLLAYTITQNAPQPYRFKANLMRFQIPNPSTWLPDTRFWRSMRETATWRFFRSMAFMVRTWARRTIWGDRLFLHFHGPATVLVQSRSSSLREVLTSQDVNELAESPAGAIPAVKTMKTPSPDLLQSSASSSPTRLSVARVDRGSVKFEQV